MFRKSEEGDVKFPFLLSHHPFFEKLSVKPSRFHFIVNICFRINYGESNVSRDFIGFTPRYKKQAVSNETACFSL